MKKVTAQKKPSTPFPVTGYFGPDYFCNREEEVKTLKRNILAGQSTVLVSNRRIGKTGLIKHLHWVLPDNWIRIYLDILPTGDNRNFLEELATAVINSIPETTAPGKKLWGYIKSLQPTFQFDPFTGNPQVSFRSGSIRPDYQTGTLFNLLEAQDKKVLISIDEFQQISSYPEKNTDSWLRSIIQNLTNVVFIFSGSQQHLMNEIFANPSRPFFRSTSFLQLNKLPFQEYKNFIMNKFQEARRNIDEKTIDEILEWTHCHTFYVQMLCSRVFSTGAKKIDNSIWKEEALKILKEQESIFYNYRVLLTRHQWNLLRAIALEETGYELTSKSFISKYNLGSPSTVLRSATSLLGKEFLLTGTDTSGNKYYSVYDVFLERWIQYNFGTMH